MAEIGTHGTTQAEHLADFEAGATASLRLLRLGVTKPLPNLALDCQRPHVVLDDEQLSGAPIETERQV